MFADTYAAPVRAAEVLEWRVANAAPDEVVYLLHFSSPLAHARHYLGTAKDLERRLKQHRAGKGARICAVAVEQGIELILARTWRGGRRLERALKNQHNAPRLCPVCAVCHAH